jgi:hypothetical protein
VYQKQDFNGGKILGASAGQSVPYLGANRLRGVQKTYIMKQTLRHHGQLIGCISWFHSNQEQVFNGGKILGASAGQSVPYLGANRLRGVQKTYIMKQTLWHHGQLIGCISWYHSSQEQVFNGGKILGASAGQSVPYLGAGRLRGVQKKKMKQTLRRHGQLIGCISWFHSNQEQVFIGGKIPGASAG